MAESDSPDTNRLPVLTIMLVLVSLVVFLFPAVTRHLVYDREQILAGELWRVVTGITVHFSWTHLGYNSLILLLAGWLVERDTRSFFVGLVILTAILSSMYFLLFIPDMKQFGGLSGVVSSLVVYLSLVNFCNATRGRWLWMTILVLLVAKIVFEVLTQQAVFATYASNEVQVVPSTHVIGSLLAVLFVYLARISQNAKWKN